MSMIVLNLLSIVLLVIAAIHLLWAVGVFWPIKTEAKLARAVIGAKGIDKMPPGWASLMVALLLTIAALWPWLTPENTALVMYHRLGFGGLIVIFGLRGIFSYLPFWRNLTPEQPFSRNDQRYFGPLCLVIAACFAYLFQGVL